MRAPTYVSLTAENSCLNQSHDPSLRMGAAKTGRGRAPGFPLASILELSRRSFLLQRNPRGLAVWPLLLMHCSSTSSSAACTLSQVFLRVLPINLRHIYIPPSQSHFPGAQHGHVIFKKQNFLGLSSMHIVSIIHKLIRNYHHYQSPRPSSTSRGKNVLKLCIFLPPCWLSPIRERQRVTFIHFLIF